MLEQCDQYIRHWLPSRITPGDLALLGRIGCPVAIEVNHTGVMREWRIRANGDGQLHFDEEANAACRYRMSASMFLELIAARISPQRAFFTGKLKIEGDMFLALKVGSLLGDVFKRLPYTQEQVLSAKCCVARRNIELSAHQRAMLTLHLDEEVGAPYWIEVSRRTGLRASDLHTFDDLKAFGPMRRDILANASYRALLPQQVARRNTPLMLGETGGTTGAPITLAWTREDFARAFADPLPAELDRRGIRPLRQWLFAGPTGPHIIGKAADAIAQRTTGIDALKIDFDPRWHRCLVSGSLASERHLQHVCEQTLHHLRRNEVDALFITPSVLNLLLRDHVGPWPERLRVVHLGGQSITPEEQAELREMLPTSCALINGYGNSMFGCLLEEEKHPLLYVSRDERLVISPVRNEETFEPCEEGECGRVMFHRFDESALILNQIERDEAEARGNGIYYPRMARALESTATGGIY